MTNSQFDDAKRYSLWLCPEPDCSTPLQPTIDRLANTYGSLAFPAHMTICSQLKGEIHELEKQLIRITQSNRSIQLSGKRFSYRDDFYQSLFIELEQSTCLLQLCSDALDVLGYSLSPNFLPHISLAYIDPQTFNAASAIEQLEQNLLQKTHFNRLTLMETSGVQKDWLKMLEVKLDDE